MFLSTSYNKIDTKSRVSIPASFRLNLVKIASEILDGKGGGGRKDFAQAGGTNKDKIDDAFKAIIDKIS